MTLSNFSPILTRHKVWRDLLSNVCKRLNGCGGEVASIFRLDTSYGGGKSHGLIALCHVARSGRNLNEIDEFVDSALLPKEQVRVAAFDGENADPANGRKMEDGLLAYTPWGELAISIAGRDGYERIRRSDEQRVAPGADTLGELFGEEPTLILLDELSVYLRKVQNQSNSRNQLTAFLTSLFRAVENSPNTALVYTLAIGKDGVATDAYSNENQFIADSFSEVDSVSARKATLLNPTTEKETVQVVRRRLFGSIDDGAAKKVAESYLKKWDADKSQLSESVNRSENYEAMLSSYPLHPEVLETLTSKTATLSNFQRVRGMLRLLARTVARVWDKKPDDATAIHLHHIDVVYEPIRQEIVTRLGQNEFQPAISNDISTGKSTERMALAEKIDFEHYQGLLPYGSYVARTIFLHTLAFNDPLKGISQERLRYSVLNPNTDISFIDQATNKFVEQSAYLDDRPGVPLRFLAEANLQQIIKRTEETIDVGYLRDELRNRISRIFTGRKFETVLFPSGPYDVPDEVGDGKPKLVVFNYEAVTVDGTVDCTPELIEQIYSRKGSDGAALRMFRNSLIFVAADNERVNHIRRMTRRRLALKEMVRPERILELAEHQQNHVRELESRSEHDLAIAIQQCYRNIFYPSNTRVGTSNVQLNHSVVDANSASEKPGVGEQQIIRALRDLGKLRDQGDQPDSPAFIRDRTPLKSGEITTLSLREEFRRDPGLPILIGNDVFIRGVLLGVNQGEYIYRRGELLFGQGDPATTIEIDEQSILFTMAYAKDNLIWPRSTPGDEVAPPDRPVAPPDRPVEPSDVDEALLEFTADGTLRESFVQVFEQARQKVQSIDILKIEVFDVDNAFRLIPAIRTVSGTTVVFVSANYVSKDGGELNLEFNGPVSDAKLVSEFLQPQLRDSSEKFMELHIEIEFESELSLENDNVESFTSRLNNVAGNLSSVVTALRHVTRK